MNFRAVLFAPLSLVVLLILGDLTALQQAPRAGEQTQDKAADAPTKKPALRQPGFLFLELDCHDLLSYIAFFKTVTGYDVEHQDGNFVTLRSAHGEILLNGGKGKPGDKPARYQGPRVEIGMVVGDIDAAFEEAKKHEGWRIEGKIQRQPWGVRDFRVFSPENYYVRITEGPK